MAKHNRNDLSPLLPAILAAACGLATPMMTLAQSGNPFASDDLPTENADVTVSEHLTVDLHVQDEELANVLQILSLQSQKNILVSGDVSATVNANLYNVTFYEALESILNVNGYGYVEKGAFIYVYTLEEIAEIEQAARKPVSRVIKLNYLNANDAAEFVAPLLSEIGTIKSNGDVDTWSLPDGSPAGDETYALSATLVLYDYPEHVDEIERLLADLDTRPAQVLVEATILETSLREMNGFGVDFSFISDLDFTDFVDIGGPLGSTQGLINGGDGTSDGFSPPDNQGTSGTSTAGNVAGGNATFKLGIIDDNISFFLRALDDITDVTVLSRPKVLALNRQPARVLVGRRIGFLSTTSTETSTTQTVEFLDTGTQLKFRAFIGNDGFIRMELHPSTSTGETREASSAGGAAVTIPEEVTQEITTNVLVRDGSTIVLGGLFRESTTLSRRQVPVLGDIPLLGAAFRGHDDDTRRSEIIFMITPTIVNDQILAEAGDTAADYVENVRTGSRSGLLPWSRDRQSAELNVKAEQAAMAGDTAKALHLLRRSLELNPTQPDAIRLREQLLQEQMTFPNRSILHDVFDEELQDRIGSLEPLPPTHAMRGGPGEKLPVAEAAEGELVVAGPLPDEGAEMTLSLPPDLVSEVFTGEVEIEVAEGDADDLIVYDQQPPAPGDSIEPTAGDIFDELIADSAGAVEAPAETSDEADALAEAPAPSPAATSGRTASQPLSREERMLRDLRLTVTVAPPTGETEGEPSNRSADRPTTVTLTPDSAFGQRNQAGATSTPDAPRVDAPVARLSDPLPAPPAGQPESRTGVASSTDAPEAFEPEPFTGSSLAGLEPGRETRGWDELGQSNFEGEPVESPGLIGPAYVRSPFESEIDPEYDIPAFDVLGGYWIWFRDAIVLDKGETDTDQALSGADPDDN